MPLLVGRMFIKNNAEDHWFAQQGSVLDDYWFIQNSVLEEQLVDLVYVCAYVSACVRTPIHRRTRRTILAGSDHGESSLDFPT